MNRDIQIQFYAKVLAALQELFNPESEHHIPIIEIKENTEDFMHVLATAAPMKVYKELTKEDIDPLEFNHIANRLVVQAVLGDN